MAAQKQNKDFNISEEMKDLYDVLMERGMDTDRALTIVSLMPEYAILALGNTKTARYMAQFNTELFAAEDAAKDFDSLVSYLNLAGQSSEEVANESEAESVEETEKVAEQAASGSNLRTLVFDPFTNSVLEVKGGKIIEDPVSQASMKFIRENLFQAPRRRVDEKGYYTQQRITAPYRFTLALGSSIPTESRVRLENGAELSEYKGLVLAVTDSQGNPITVEENGRQVQVHTFLRSGRALRESVSRAKEGDKVIQEEQIQNYELFLKNAQDALTKNPELKLVFEIASYTAGLARFITKGSNLAPTKISAIKNFTLEQLAETLHVQYVTNTDVSDKAVPVYYFTAPNFGYLIPVDRPKFSETAYYGIARDILSSEELTDAEKQSLLGDILYVDGVKNVDTDLTRLPLQLPVGKDVVNVPVFENGEYKTVQVALAEFVYNNTQIRLDLTNTGGELLSYSPVIRYNVPVDVFAQYTKGYELQEAPAPKPVTIQEGVQDTSGVINFLKSKLYKEKGISNEATQKQIDAAEEWYKTSPLSKVIPFNQMLHIVNSKALAEFTGYAINLYAGSNATDLYHEAWHGFSQLYLTKEEKLALYAEVKKLTGAQTYHEAEEFLAEDFRLFAISGGKDSTVKGKVKQGIFRKIWNFLKSLFGNKTYAQLQQEDAANNIIAEYYSKLFIGDISEYRPSFDNALFGELRKSKGIKINVSDEIDSYLSPKESFDVASSIDGLFAEAIIQAGLNAEVLANRSDVIPALYKYARISFANRIVEIQNEISNSKDAAEQLLLRKKLGVLEKALTNFPEEVTKDTISNATEDSVIGYHQNNSAYLKELNAVVGALDASYELDEQVNAMVRQDKSGNESSMLETSYPIVLYTLRSMRELEGKPGNYKAKLNDYGFPKLVDFKTAFNYVAQALEGMSGIEDMYSRLNKLTAVRPAVNDLIAQLGTYEDVSSRSRFDIQTKFWQSFEKAVVPLNVILGEQAYTTVETKNQDGDVVNESVEPTGEFVLKPQEAAEDSPVRLTLAREFHNTKAKYSTYLNGVRTVNLPQVLEAFKGGITPSNIVEFLQELGIVHTTNPIFDSVVTGSEYVKPWEYVRQELAFFAESKQTLNRQDELKKKRAGKTGTFRGAANRINQIVDLYAKSVGQDALRAQVNANGDREYGKTLHNTGTRLVQNLNKIASLNEIKNDPALKHLHPDNNPSMLYHPWLSKMFDMTSTDPAIRYTRKKVRTVAGDVPVQIEAYQVNGLTIRKVVDGVEQEPEGKKNMQMDDITKLLSDIHFLFGRGMMEVPRVSDKSTSIGFRLNVPVGNTEITDYAKGSYFGAGAFATPAGMNTTGTMLAEILAGEILRIRKNPTDAKLGKIQSLDVTYPEALKAGGFGNNKKLLSEYVEKKAMAIAKDESILGSKVLSTLLEDVKVREDLQQRFEEYLSSEARIIRTNVLDPISTALGKQTIIPALNSEIMNFYTQESGQPFDGKALGNTLKSLVANTFFNNVYVIDLFAGGLHNYKSADDYTKRFTLTSTGQVFRSDSKAVEFINSYIGKPFAKATGNTPTAYSPVLKTVVLKDMVVGANEEWLAAAKEYLSEDAYEAYANGINEADAQGYISFDTYRILSVLEGTWSDAQEAVFQEFVTNPNVVIDQVEEYFPVRKFQYYGPIVNGNQQQALHKYSLMPMIPNVVRGRNLESLHQQMMAGNIDYVLFESANKVSRVGDAVEAYETVNGQRRIKDNLPLTDNVNEIHTDYLKDQLFINSKFKGKNTRSTQLGKLLGNGIYENGKVVQPELAGALEQYNAEIDNLIKIESAKLVDQVKTPADLVRLFQRELDRRDVAAFKIEAIKEVNGELVYNLDSLPSGAELAKIASALVNKRLLRAKLNGEQLVQLASTGMEAKPALQEIEKVDTVKYTNDLRFYTLNEDGTVKAAQVKIALQGEYKKLLLDVHPDGSKIRTLARLNEAIKDENWLNEKNRRVMISLTGVRIPVQGLNSMEFFEVAEFLPETAGNVIVVPSEITVKAGSDFDIDKLTLYMPSIDVAPKLTQTTKEFGGITVESGYIKESVLKKLAKENPAYADDLTSMNTDILLDALLNKSPLYKLTERDQEVISILEKAKAIPKVKEPVLAEEGINGVQNNLISAMRNILLSEKNYGKLITPISTNLVKENSKAFNELSAKRKNAKKISHPASYSYNLQKHQDNSIMKRALGIGAKGNTFNTLFQRISKPMPDVLFVGNKNAPIVLSEIGMFTGPVYLGKLKDDQNIHSKSDIINQLINGWVDAGKDPWIADIKADDIKAPILISMLDMGINYDYAVKFLNHPAVDRYAALKRLQNSPVAGLYFNPAVETNKNYVPEFGDYGIFKNLLIGDDERISMPALVAEAYMILGGITEASGERIISSDEFQQYSKATKTAFYAIQITKEPVKPLSESQLDSAADEQILARLFLFLKASEDLKQLRLRMDLDTSRSNSFIDAAIASEGVEAVLKGNLSELASEVYNTSIIKTFAGVKELQKTIFEKYFSIRSNAALQNTLSNAVSTVDFMNTNPYETKEEYVSRFYNDFTLFLFQNTLHPTSISDLVAGKVTEYKGVPIKLQKIKSSALGIDGNIVINPELLRAEFDQRAESTNNKLPFSTTNELVSFVLETEYLRLQPEFVSRAKEIGYSEASKEIAVRAINNIYHSEVMLGRRPGTAKGLADQWLSIKNNPEYKEFLADFRLPEYIYKAEHRGNYFLALNTRIKTGEDQDAMHEEILKLQNAVDFPEISAFFRTLPVKLFYLHGTGSPKASIMNIMPQEQTAVILSQALNTFNKLSKKDQAAVVARFKGKFDTLSQRSSNPVRDYTRNYLNFKVDSIEASTIAYTDVAVTDEQILEFRKKCQG